MSAKTANAGIFKGLTPKAARVAYSVSSLRKRQKDVSTVAAGITQEQNRSELEKIVLPPLDAVTNRHLLRWMFAFLAPVKLLMVASCLWLMLWVGAEVLTTRQAGEVVNQIKLLHL